MYKIFTPAALAISFFAAGCTTSPKDARDNTPTLELSSEKSSKIVAACIAEKWEDLYRVGALSVRPTPKGFTVIQQDQLGFGKDIPFLADIEDQGSGSITRYYNNAISARKIDQSVINCQK